jgi:C4-dicarboxylate transporter DctM subunit
MMGALPFGIFAVLVLLSVPIAFALILAGALILVVGEGLPLVIVPQQIVAGMDSFPMLAVPLFILAGSIMDVGGISRRLVELASALVGHLPGGLGQVVVVSEIFFSGVSGSTSADAAAIGGIMVPQLTSKGYSRARATSIVSAACAMGILIPPAIVMVIFGVMGNVSIGKLFVACIPPALLMAFGLMLQIGWQARRQNWPRDKRASGPTIRRAAMEAILPLFMIVVVLGGIRVGLFTPTEAAAVAVAYALTLAAVVYRAFSWKQFTESLVQTSVVSGMVLLVVGAARLLSWVFAVTQVPQELASMVMGMGGGQIVFLLFTIAVFLPLGAILEGVPAVVLLTPILLPLAKQLGIDPVHYGAVVVATQGISVFMPPVGVSLLVACSVGRVEPAAVSRHLWPYLALMLLFTLLIAMLPEIVLFLPRLIGY